MFRTIFTTLTALLKSGLCATQLCIRSDTASHLHWYSLVFVFLYPLLIDTQIATIFLHPWSFIFLFYILTSNLSTFKMYSWKETQKYGWHFHFHNLTQPENRLFIETYIKDLETCFYSTYMLYHQHHRSKSFSSSFMRNQAMGLLYCRQPGETTPQLFRGLLWKNWRKIVYFIELCQNYW